MGFLGEPHWGGTMQGNEVVDLSRYRATESSDNETDEAGLQFLPAGTKLLLGQYTIDGYLNCGGFGITYTATDSLLRKVVIKECFPGELAYRTGTSMAARSPKYKDELATIVRHFVEEAHRLANMNHACIVHVHQIFEENDTAYMAMDFIDGPDLLDIVDTNKLRLGPKAVQELTAKMLSAIKHVHDHGMLHRDISPDNILIAPAGDPVLIDFGAAREKTQQKRRALSKLKFVKDGYSPQEFYIAGSEQGPWSDLYSFAASIYHVITGEPPSNGQARLGALAAKKPDPYVPLTSTVTGYPEGFLAAIDTALEVIPENRLQSADEWLARLPEPEAVGPATQPVATALAKLWAARPASLAGGAIAAGLATLALSIFLGPNSSPQPIPLTELAVLEVPETGETTVITPSLDAKIPRQMASLSATELPLPFQAHSAPSPRAFDTAPIMRQRANTLPIATLSNPFGDPPSRVEAAMAPARMSAPAAHPAPHGIAPGSLPEVAGPLADIQMVMFDVEAPVTLPFDAPLSVPVNRGGEVAPLPRMNTERRVITDTTPPEFHISTGQVLPSQIIYSRWDIDMPFTSRTERIRSAHTIVITDVSEAADLSVSGSWIAEGVILYTFNGQTLAEGTPLSAIVLDSMTIDPDGYTRSTVRYRDPTKDILDRALLAVPVVRKIGLADGTVLETRSENQTWVTRVVSVGNPDKGLVVGDILRAEDQTGIVFATHEDVENALRQLAVEKAETAHLTVLRDGRRQTVDWALARAG